VADVLHASDVGASPQASSNIRHLSRTELPGGGQIVIQGHHAYVGHQNGPEGTTILDVSDPRKPKIVGRLMVPNELTHTHKVRVVGDLMVTNSEHQPGSGRRNEFKDAGFRIYDIADPANPRLVTFVQTFGKGVHRFDLDESYAYISTEMEGFVGNTLVIYDIRHPSRPVEVSRWWMHGQNVGGGEPPHPKGTEHRLHHAMRSGDQMYAGCWASGVAIIDVSDIGQPRTLSHYQYDPPRPEPTHTFLKVPFPINGRTIAVSKPIAPVHMRAIAASAGTNIDAAISLHGRQAWPWCRIQATIGMVMMMAISTMVAAGAESSIALPLVPTARSTPSTGRPRTIMPANMAMTISM